MWFKEVLHVTSHRAHRSPPHLSVVKAAALDQLWSLLTDQQRQRTLITLCGIVLRQFDAPHDDQEVRDDHS
jgi:hypothetical protein